MSLLKRSHGKSAGPWRGFALVLTLALLAGLSGCGGGAKARAAAAEAIDAVKSADAAAVTKLWGEGVFRDLGDGKDARADTQTRAMMARIMKGLSFRLLSAKADGGEASVKAEITNYAMKPVMRDFLAKSYGAALDYALVPKTGQPSDEEIDGRDRALMNSLLSAPDVPKVKTDLDIRLRRVGGNWEIVPDPALLTALYGGISSYADAMASAFKARSAPAA